MIIRQEILQVKCDQCYKVSEALPVSRSDEVKIPKDWVRTQSAENHIMHILDGKNRQIASISSNIHFCSTSCFMIYLHAQLERYLDLVATITEEV